MFPNSSRAKRAQTALRKSDVETEDKDDFVTAKSVPLDLWPLETRIQSSLGMRASEHLSTTMKERIKMRYASKLDVKQRHAKSTSEFYKRFGLEAGKEMYGSDRSGAGTNDIRQGKRRRIADDLDIGPSRSSLDAELDLMRQEGQMVDLGSKSEHRKPKRSRRRPAGFRNAKTVEELDTELDAFLNDDDYHND